MKKKLLNPRKKRRVRNYTHNGKRCSKGEKYVALYLEKHNIKYCREKTFPTCLSPKKRNLRYDFYLPEYKLLIEYQGQHHYKPISNKVNARKSHERTVCHDNIKKQFADKFNFKLIRIPYYVYDNLDYILDRIFNFIKSKRGKYEIRNS